VCIVEVSRIVKIPIIGSGGMRDGIDVAKAIALGASLASLSQPVLKAAVKGVEETKAVLSLLLDELRVAMFLVGAESVQDLHATPTVVVGRTAEWLSMRGFDVENYARRGLN
jgi:isopentenyl-diphosphate delta-isomerase